MTALKPSMLMVRWLALGAAVGASLALLMSVSGIAGPWRGMSLVLALLSVAAIVALLLSMRQGDAAIEEAGYRALRDEAELVEMKRELERHAQFEQQMREAKQAADAAVMAKGEFLATMSHEIRTPLNGIVPMLDLLMHATLAADHAELVRTAYTSSQQMLRIVDDILDYSKLEANKLELESTGFNLRELIEGVLQLMERPAHGKGLRLSLQLDPSVRLPVRGDPVRLRQVIANLVSNAVKFTERGSVSVSVKRIGETAAQHQLRFEVRDTGIGISSDAQHRLFQAFSQADASTTRLYGGTGLGLAISKRIVDLMDGRIGVESERGQGATFWFEIPLLKVHGDIQAADPGASTSGRLLLLSADPRLRLRLSMLLPNWGLRVSAVETTQEALDRLRTAANQGSPWTYQIVLADLAGMRNTAVALHRNLERQAVYGDLRLVFLYGDDPVPDELQRGTSVLSRQAPDEDLRAALSAAAEPAGAPSSRSASTSTSTLMSGSTSPTPQHAAAASGQPADMDSETIDAAVETPPAVTRSARVLLVEDNPVNLMVGQRLLSVLGITCDTASNGEAALVRMSASRYDVILMDCQMPVMDGYTATQRWRQGEESAGDGRRLPIVAMTANAMAGDRQKCLDAGMDDYLPKPVTRSELERCLHRWWNSDIAATRDAEHERLADLDRVPAADSGYAAEAAERADDRPNDGVATPERAAAPDAHTSVRTAAMADVDSDARTDTTPPPVHAPPAAPALVPAAPHAAAAASEDAAETSAAATISPSTDLTSTTWMHHPAQPLPPAPSPIPAATAAPLPAAHTPAAASAAPPAAAAPARPAPVKLAAAISPTQSPAQPDAPIFGAPQAPAPIATNASPGRPIAPLPASPSPLPAAVAPVADLPRKPLPPVLDDAVLDELRSMLGGEVDRLIDIFLEDCPRLIEALENAASGPDYVGLRDAAHSLKSSSANLGAMSLSTAARRIELAAREQALERPAVAVALVANEFQRARQALRKLQQHQPS